MKRVSMFVIAAVLAAPAFAADDLCTVNLQKLDNAVAAKATIADPLKSQVEEAKKQATDAQAAGDLKACGTHAERALQLLDAPGDDGSGATS
ncbi:hypothetical protein K5Q02_09130 [Pseudomonas sp. MM211]|uniref:hypothetical protein n=1 Tax=Pseudomonas sp. MM211 TaxID=2866808 RepID=UPI001CEC45C1|nr:hypothetical protein [Pseudomonas sp. MM211]UCJ18506.1 hypothetical protein K5Q02_09130 [Pseudomonas sp. MM211]